MLLPQGHARPSGAPRTLPHITVSRNSDAPKKSEKLLRTVTFKSDQNFATNKNDLENTIQSNLQNGRRELQIVRRIKTWCSEYTKNSCNSTTKRPTTPSNNGQ